ncbi:MAG: TonB-dependent receptor [Acidobacteria bacterium]|nr:TonB-dependent receptor [Acidobacteriota bacterium]
MKTFKGMLFCASAIALGGSHLAFAQEDESERKLGTVTVTGSLIQGTPEDAALPVDVLSAEDLRLQGNPSALDIIKSLPVSSGVLGDTNQFDGRAQGSEGSGTVNLRGLGSSRTLVLLDGKRLAPNPFAFAGNGSVDTNILPLAAIGRIEILKDGAAATYGSDAVAGVVNFITRTDFDGFEVGGDYTVVDGSDGDYKLNAVGGWDTDFGNFLLAAGYQHRSELATTERDWALKPFLDNPQGGWSLVGNPGAFLPVGAAFTPVQGVTRDPGCGVIGGIPLLSGATPVCSFQFTPFDNIVEEDNRYQVLGKADFDLSDKHRLSVQGFYSATEVPRIAYSPSFPPVGGASSPTADASLVPGQFYVPATNPGFAALVAQNPGLVSPAATGAYLIATRPLGYAGNALEGGRGSERSYREYEHFRISADLKGELTDSINYTLSALTGSQTGRRTNEDTVVNRYALALRGLGGDTCNVAANTPGLNGCLWFNPFSNAITANAVTGQANPNSIGANSIEVLDFILEDTFTEQEIKLTVLEGVLDGQLPIALGDGNIGWAFGGQYRKEEFDRQYNDIANLDVTPCIATVTTGATNCAQPVGALGFLAGSRPLSAEQDIYALFGELSLPFTENFNASLAARYEDYGGDIGSTFDPKLSVRWQVAEPLAFRASIGTTFRGPALTQVATGSLTSLQSVGGTFRAVDIAGNPGLKPESALTYNVGGIFKTGNFNLNVDYWSFDFDDSVVTEPVASMVAAMFPTGLPNNCGNPAFAALQARFTFTGPCAVANVSRLSTQYTNGPNIKTSGIDVLTDYTFEDVFGRGVDLELGGSGSYVLEYEVGEVTVEGIAVGAPFSAVGFLNFQTIATPLPELKFEAYANASTENVNARLTARYIGEYEDQRTGLFTVGNPNFPTPGIILPQGQTIKSQVTYDGTVVIQMPWDSTMSFSVENILDTKPPFARLELNYDPYTGDAVGRTFKIGFTKRFGAGS